METKLKKIKFKFRAFTALIVLWSFIIENLSGVILYIVPPGRIAHWTNWKLWGFTKEQWAALHTIFGYIFLIFAAIHIYYNWKAIMNYIKRKIKAGVRMRMELAVASILTILVFVATAISIPPFSSVMNLGEKFKNSWEESSQEPFIPHAEELSLEELIEQIGISLDEALAILEKERIEVKDTSLQIRDIAKDNNTSPVAIYEVLEKDPSKKTPSGKGFGRKTLETLAQEMDIPLVDIFEFLRSEGIETQKNEVIRTIADKLKKTPYELVEMIRQLKK